MRARQRPAAGFRHPPVTGGAGGRGAAFVDQPDGDPGQGGLVDEALHQPADLPLPQPQVVPPPRRKVQHPARITDVQHTHPLPHRPRHDATGGFVLGLTDPAPVPALHQSCPTPVLPPPPRPLLTWLRRPTANGTLPALRVGEVHPVLGADRPPRHQQSLPARAGHGVGVDDSQVHPGHPARIRLFTGRIDGHRHLGGHVKEQPATFTQQGDRPDLLDRIRHLPRQAHPQRRTAFTGGDPDPAAVEGERAVIPAHRHQPPPTTRKPGQHVTVLAAFRRREPRIGEPAQHRPGTRGVQFAERARPRPGQLPTQLLIADLRRVVAAAPPGVDLQHTCPHITGRTQQPETPPPLPRRHPQRHPGRAMHDPQRSGIPTTRHEPKPTPPLRQFPPNQPANVCGQSTRVSVAPQPARRRRSRYATGRPPTRPNGW